jgi:hypothetical protein
LQNDVTGWIKRFSLRKQHDRAIEFADKVEEDIPKWAVKGKSAIFNWRHGNIPFAKVKRFMAQLCISSSTANVRELLAEDGEKM